MVSGDPWDSTRVSPIGEGCYTATIGPQWMLAMVPQGGVLAAIAARALAAELHVDRLAMGRNSPCGRSTASSSARCPPARW